MEQRLSKILFDFSNIANSGEWTTVNDVVMGGVSHSSFEVLPDRTARFSGNLSLENNGGFASVKTDVDSHDFAPFSGIVIRIKGDGKIYSFRLLDPSDGISYRSKFTTKKGDWMELRLQFESFLPTFRGRLVKNAEPVKPESITQLGFLISDTQAGRFELFIDWIKCF